MPPKKGNGVWGRGRQAVKRAREKKAPKVAPPTYAAEPFEMTHHGDTRQLPYHWLRKKEDPRVKQTLKAENEYAKSVIDQPLKRDLYAEMKRRWKETDASIPMPERSFFYYDRIVEGEEYGVSYRRPVAGNAGLVDECAALFARDPDATMPEAEDEEVLIDLNRMVKEEGVEYIEISEMDVAPCQHRMLASFDLSDGEEIFTLIAYDLPGSALTPAPQPAAAASPVKRKGKGSSAAPHVTEVRRMRSSDERLLTGEAVWASDYVFFYTTMDAAQRPFRVHRHDLRLPEDAADELIFEEHDAVFTVGNLSKTDDELFLTFETSSKTCGEVHHMRLPPKADQSTVEPGHTFECFRQREPGVEYAITHHDDFVPAGGGPHWFILHNRGDAVNFQMDILSSDAGLPTEDVAQWRPLFTYDPSVKLDSVSLHHDFLVLSIRRNALEHALLWCWRGSTLSSPSSRDLALPVAYSDLTSLSDIVQQSGVAPLYSAETLVTTAACGHPDYRATTYRLMLSTMTLPTLELELRRAAPAAEGMKKGESVGAPSGSAGGWSVHLLKVEPVHNYDPSLYAAELLWAPAPHGTCDRNDRTVTADSTKDHVLVPVFVCYRKDTLVRNASGDSGGSGNPMWIDCYSSYGSCADPAFDSSRVALLDRGVVFAEVCARGGGELGRLWRNAGRMAHRPNTFSDLIHATEYLLAEGWGARGRVAVCGESAGGNVVGTVLNQRPDLFSCIVARVPFVDVLTTMLDPSVPLTAQEWDEWGNPLASPEVYGLIKGYSPTDNLPAAAAVLPHMLIESGWTDSRVQYHEPAIWTAMLRAQWAPSAEAGRELAHICRMGAGHGGASGRYKHLAELSDVYAFALWALKATVLRSGPADATDEEEEDEDEEGEEEKESDEDA